MGPRDIELPRNRDDIEELTECVDDRRCNYEGILGQCIRAEMDSETPAGLVMPPRQRAPNERRVDPPVTVPGGISHFYAGQQPIESFDEY